ncbi:MAG: methyltransferase domain-containing protein [Candidatus Saliniplasma sp.]
MSIEIERWERKKGAGSIQRAGIDQGDTLLDFGSGYGHYSIPGATVVDKSGTVYAADIRGEPLSKTIEKTSKHGLTNIKNINTPEREPLRFEFPSIDDVFLFDILHYFEKDKRKKRYRELYRVLKPGGKLFVYPKHTEDDFPMGELKGLKKEEVVEEVCEEWLSLDEKICRKTAHGEEVSLGVIFKFMKTDDLSVSEGGT